MIVKRLASERGHADHGWLDTRHTFSFADYYDPQHMGFRALRVINEDRVAPGQGFGTHGHRDMEILSYVLEGELAHKDSMGTGSVIRPGDVQRMSAGSGVRHSEFNGSAIEVVHFLQIWILPDKEGIAPGYEQKHFSNVEKQGRLRLIASPDAQDGSVTIHADARVYAGRFGHDQAATLALPDGRHAWVHVARGRARVAGQDLAAGDALGLSGEKSVAVQGLDKGEDAEVLVFDLA
ncbi:MAG: pirin family protein [Verrucomicrobiota bacterium]